MAKQQWFNTLNEALASESTPKQRDLIAEWPLGRNINYGETASVTTDRRFISVYRNQDGLYERPLHYLTKAFK